MADFLIAWGPMILLIAVWLWVMKRGGAFGYKKHVEEVQRVAEAQLVEMKRTNETLARIEQVLKEGRASEQRND